MNALQKAREQQARVAVQMRGLTETALKEDRAMTAEETQSWEAMRADFEAREKTIERLEYATSKNAELDQVIERYVKDADGNPIDMRAAGDRTNDRISERDDRPAAGERAVTIFGKRVKSPYGRRGAAVEPPDLMLAFDAFLRFGINGLTPEHRQMVMARQQAIEPEMRFDQAVGTDAYGGYTVPTGFSDQLEIALKQFGGLRNVATVLRTSTGNDLHWPTVDDTSNTGAIITEAAEDSPVVGVTFAEVILQAFTYTSRPVRVSMELMQDSAFDLSALLARLLGERLGRITATHYVTGTGSSQPRGISVAASVGKAAASNAAITHNEMLDLEHSVDPAYRLGARWLFNDGTLKVLKQLKDDENRPIWQPNIANEVPATIDGYPYTVDQAMPAIGTLAKSVLFGDLSKYIIRDVLGMTMVVLRELFALNRQTGFLMYMRTDADLIDAGGGAVKALRHPT